LVVNEYSQQVTRRDDVISDYRQDTPHTARPLGSIMKK